MLLPFFPLSPQRLAKVSLLPIAPFGTFSDPSDWSFFPDCLNLDPTSRPPDIVAPPPRMAETDECAHLVCFRIAEVIVMHSVVIRVAGLTAMAILG